MPTGQKQLRLNRWRSSWGVCCICGQCIGAPLRHPADDAGGIDDAIDTDGLLLTKEDPVRLCMLEHNMLGVHQDAHLVDDYTFLEEKRTSKGPNFIPEFQTHFEEFIRPLNPVAFDALSVHVLDQPPSELYLQAVAIMKQTVTTRTVAACQRCNRAMYKLYEHTMAVYRCFDVTAMADFGPLEPRTIKANTARKVVQQIALYFVYDGARGAWHAKPSKQLLIDAALWRCIAFLYSWGQSGMGDGVRMRLIALFYASVFIHLTSSDMKQMMPFEVLCIAALLLRFFFNDSDDNNKQDWHTYVWRPMSCSCFAEGTFLNMSQSEVGGVIDIVRRNDGPECARIIIARMMSIARNDLAAWEASIIDPERHLPYGWYYDFGTNNKKNTTKAEDIFDMMRETVVNVRDERSLLMFMCDKHGGKHGIQRLLDFFCYNVIITGAYEQKLATDMICFKKAMGATHSMLVAQRAAKGGTKADDGDETMLKFGAMSLRRTRILRG